MSKIAFKFPRGQWVNNQKLLIMTWCFPIVPFMGSIQAFTWYSILYKLTFTHWGWDKMAAVSQTIFSNAFSWMKMYEFQLKFHWSILLRVQLTIFQHWFRLWLGTNQATSHYLNQWWLDYQCIYASLSLNELSHKQLETHGCLLSTAATDALELKHQAISSNSADYSLYWFICIQKYCI